MAGGRQKRSSTSARVGDRLLSDTSADVYAILATGRGSFVGRSGGTHTMPSEKPAEPIPNAALKWSRLTTVSRAVIYTSCCLVGARSSVRTARR
jgi:hypothetical protein